VFADLTREGGTAAGVPTVAGAGAGDHIIVLDGARVVLADEQEVAIAQSRQTTITMIPTAPPAPSTQKLPLFQSNHVAIRAERGINWTALAGACVYLTANYLESGSPGV